MYISNLKSNTIPRLPCILATNHRNAIENCIPKSNRGARKSSLGQFSLILLLQSFQNSFPPLWQENPIVPIPRRRHKLNNNTLIFCFPMQRRYSIPNQSLSTQIGRLDAISTYLNIRSQAREERENTCFLNRSAEVNQESIPTSTFLDSAHK